MLDCAKDHTFSMCMFVCLDFVVRNDPKQKKFKSLSDNQLFRHMRFPYREHIKKNSNVAECVCCGGKAKGLVVNTVPREWDFF